MGKAIYKRAYEFIDSKYYIYPLFYFRMWLRIRTIYTLTAGAFIDLTLELAMWETWKKVKVVPEYMRMKYWIGLWLETELSVMWIQKVIFYPCKFEKMMGYRDTFNVSLLVLQLEWQRIWLHSDDLQVRL